MLTNHESDDHFTFIELLRPARCTPRTYVRLTASAPQSMSFHHLTHDAEKIDTSPHLAGSTKATLQHASSQRWLALHKCDSLHQDWFLLALLDRFNHFDTREQRLLLSQSTSNVQSRAACTPLLFPRGRQLPRKFLPVPSVREVSATLTGDRRAGTHRSWFVDFSPTTPRRRAPSLVSRERTVLGSVDFPCNVSSREATPTHTSTDGVFSWT